MENPTLSDRCEVPETVVDLPPGATLAEGSCTFCTGPPLAMCADCGAALTGVYCADCGQHVADSHRSVWRFVADFFDNTFCWDNRLLRTFKPLFRQPGYLTREFIAGRRVRYVHPLRLFLFTSAVCLTLLQFGHDHLVERGTLRVAPGGNDHDFQWIASDQVTASKQDSGPHRGNGASLPGRVTSEPQSDGVEARFEQALETRIAQNGGVARLNKAISDGVQSRISWIALALLPVFALGLRALYWRMDAFYFSHLVFP